MSHDNHPDDLQLELARTGEAAEETRNHLEECADCRERSALMDGLSEALRTEAIEIPSKREETVLAHAKKRARLARRTWKLSRPLSWLLPAAAAATLACIMIWVTPGSRGPAGPSDINSDGKVDIVDALVLARSLRDNGQLEGSWDLNGDGTIDQQDVDHIARSCVKLKGIRR